MFAVSIELENRYVIFGNTNVNMSYWNIGSTIIKNKLLQLLNNMTETALG